MYNTSEIDAIVAKAKRQRSQYIRSNLFAGMVPIALAAILSLAIVQLSAGPSQDPSQQSSVAPAGALNG